MTSNRLKVLIIEDEPDLCEGITSFLQLEGIDATGVTSSHAADAWLNQHQTDIILLDIGLPDQDGVTWLRQRQSHPFGIIITSARGELSDRMRGLSAGADAYLVKPVELSELILIIRNLAQRLGFQSTPIWSINPLTWALTTPDKRQVRLTASESAIITRLATDAGQTVSRDELILALGYQPLSYDIRRMEILIRRLRNKVRDQLNAPLPLETVHGHGYAFAEQIGIVK
jgi:DNA-binding response OmpR family regulator